MQEFDPESIGDGAAIILIFAPWCPSCVATKPEFSKLFTNPELSREGINVYSVNTDEHRDIPLEVSGTPVQTVPHIVIKDREGNFEKYSGPRTEKEFAQAAIKFQKRSQKSTEKRRLQELYDSLPDEPLLLKDGPLEGGHWETPKGMPARREEEKKFGRHCFLLPDELKFPICNSKGQVSKEGLEAAYKRAKEWKYEEVAQKAKQMLYGLRGGQARCKCFTRGGEGPRCSRNASLRGMCRQHASGKCSPRKSPQRK